MPRTLAPQSLPTFRRLMIAATVGAAGLLFKCVLLFTVVSVCLLLGAPLLLPWPALGFGVGMALLGLVWWLVRIVFWIGACAATYAAAQVSLLGPRPRVSPLLVTACASTAGAAVWMASALIGRVADPSDLFVVSLILEPLCIGAGAYLATDRRWPLGGLRIWGATAALAAIVAATAVSASLAPDVQRRAAHQPRLSAHQRVLAKAFDHSADLEELRLNLLRQEISRLADPQSRDELQRLFDSVEAVGPTHEAFRKLEQWPRCRAYNAHSAVYLVYLDAEDNLRDSECVLMGTIHDYFHL